MNHKEDIKAELKELGIQLPEALNPFILPPGYFEIVSEEIAQEIENQRIEKLFTRQMPYHLEEGYFDQFAHQLSTEVSLSDLPKQNIFEVPTTYFDQLPDQIMNRLETSPVEMKPIRKISSSFSYLSIAASILLILGIGFLMMQQEHKPSLEQQLAALSDTEINSYIVNHPLDFGDVVFTETIDENLIDLPSLEGEVYKNLDLDKLSSDELDKFVF